MKINELVLRNRFVVEAGPVPPVDDPAAAPAAPPAKGPGFVAQLGKGLDSLKAGIAGAKAGYGANQAQRAGTEQAEKIGAMYADKWNKAIGQNPALNTPANLQMFMKNNTKDSGIKIPPPPPELNPAVTTKYIIDVTSQSLAASALGMPAEEPAAAEPAPSGPKFAPGVSITSDEPIMIKFKNTDYTLNDQGHWAPATAPNKLANQAMAAFLDKQHDIYLNSQPEPQAAPAAAASAAPVAPEQPAATTPVAPEQPAATTPEPTFKNSTEVTPTTVKQTTSSAAPKTKVDADNLIKQTGGDPEKIKAMIAALQGTPA